MMRKSAFGSLILACQSFIAVMTVSVSPFTGLVSAYASSSYSTIEIQAPGRSQYDDLVRQAEQLAAAEIVNRFDADAGLNEVQIVVLGRRGGEIVPILSANVSRQQWQSSPQVDSWVQYYSPSYALLYRSDDGSDESGAQGVHSFVRPRVTVYQDPTLQVEEAYDEGRLTRDEYQNLIDALD